MKRGRPKGRSRDSRSFGPLGDLIRKHRLEKRMGLLDVADAVDCSVQFISNIEHGRAPLPWDKVNSLARALDIEVEALQAANLTVRSDFKSYVNMQPKKKVATPQILSAPFTAMAATAKDDLLQQVIASYQTASMTNRKKFAKAALKLLNT